MFTNVILTAPSSKYEQTICVSIEPDAYVILTEKKWASMVKKLAQVEKFEIFRPYYDSPRVTILGQDLAKMVGEDLIGSSRKRQHSKKVKSSAWQTLWDKLEGWSDEQNEMDLSAQQLIKRTYTGKNQKSALDKYQALREEGWGSHETLVKLIKGEFKELFESLPESFDWKPEGSIAQ